MKMIDVDAIKALKFKGIAFCNVPEAKQYQTGWNEAIDAVVEGAVAPKHVKWIRNRMGGYYCPECQMPIVPYGHVVPDSNGGYKKMFPNYCSWCGVRGEIGEDPSHPTEEDKG